MSLGVNNILDCLELNTPANKRDIEEFLPSLTENSSSSLSHLLIDVDTSLERLYGGFYPDWLAGGEWSHLYSYILSLLKTCQELSICLIFCFDGTLYRYGQSQWYYEQIQQRKKVNQIFKHLKQNKSGLPRRHLWFSPPAFQLCLRTILRELNSPHLLIYQTWGYGSCQHQEQIKIYAQKYTQSLIGIVSSDLEFFFPMQIKDQRIAFRNFSSKHFKLSLKGKLTLVQIQLNQCKEQFSLDNQQFALLLTLLGNHLLSDSDLVHFHNDLLHEHDSLTSKRNVSKSNGTNSPPAATDTETKSEHDSPDNQTPDVNEDHQQTSPVQPPSQSRPASQTINSTVDHLIPRLVDFVKKQSLDKEEIDFHSIANQIFKHLNDEESHRIKTQLLIDSYDYYCKSINDTSTTSFSSNQTSTTNKSDDNDPVFDHDSGINSEVLRTALNLHKQGLMMPWIFQCLYKHEITFPVAIEPEMCNTIPSVCEFYRPIRKYLYSLLFDIPTKIREQVYNSEHGSYLTEVLSEVLPSKPTIEQLWFGTSPDEDRQLRLKTFLQSLSYCDLPRIHSISHDYLLFICLLRFIYMEFFRYSSTSAILHTYELIAFISQAVLIIELQPKPLMNSQSTSFSNQHDHIQIGNYETRPVQLAHLFMRGLETMIFANEICGAPIHPKYCCPAHFFNGKLFHQKYSQAHYYQQNQDLIFILSDGNTHCAQIISNLLDVVLDRPSNNQIHHTPMQQQYQYSAVQQQQQQQQQRVLKYPFRQTGTPTLLANSTRPLMRTNNKQAAHQQQPQQTPIANYRQQQPPPVKQAAHLRNGAAKKNNHATPFNAKAQQHIKKFNTHTPNTMNFSTPQQQHSLPSSQWTDPNHPAIQTQHQPSRAINSMQSMPMQHPTPLSNTFMNSLDEQMLHLHIQPPPTMTTPMSYSHPPAILNPHIPMAPYNHLHPPAAYPMPNGATFYQPSPQSTNSYPQPFTTPYHPHHPAILPGLPPHAPLAPQRTVHFPTNNTTTVYQQPPQRLSPTSMQTQEINIQALQQRILDQQTPISLQRQLTRLPITVDYSQFDIHRSNSNYGISIPVQSCLHPSMLTEHQQRLHGH